MDGCEMDYSKRVCQGVCQIADPDMGLCVGLCCTDSDYVLATYVAFKRQHAEKKRAFFKEIPSLEILITPKPEVPSKSPV